MKLYYLVDDCGDGSATVRWYKNYDTAQQALNDSEDGDGIMSCMNDGGPRSINLPDGFDIDMLGPRINKE